MANQTHGKSAHPQSGNLPEWVIVQMIALCRYAECNGLPEFEAKLIDATEVALAETIAKRSVPQSGGKKPSETRSNVVRLVA
jgi:hypothetical protein